MIKNVIVGSLCGVLTGALVFSVTWLGPGGTVYFPFVLVVLGLTAGPGALVEAILIAGTTHALAPLVRWRRALVAAAVLAGAVMGLLNVFPAERMLHSVVGDNSAVKLSDLPIAYALGGICGGAACGFGASIPLEPRRTA
jgi:hypothetical protein